MKHSTKLTLTFLIILAMVFFTPALAKKKSKTGGGMGGMGGMGGGGGRKYNLHLNIFSLWK